MKVSKTRIKQIIKEEYRKIREHDTTSVIHDELDSDLFKEQENIILGAVRELVREGASPDQMERLLRGIQDAISYGFAGQGHEGPEL